MGPALVFVNLTLTDSSTQSIAPNSTRPHMSAPRFKPNQRGMPSKFDPDKHPIDAFLLAKEGKTDNEIAQALGVDWMTFSSWTKKFPAVVYALSRARNVVNEKGQTGAEMFREYVYNRLPVDLQRYWDHIDRWHDHVNGQERIEALLQPLGTQTRQSLFLHAMVHCNFKTADAMRMVNLSYSTMQKWIAEDPDFPKLLDQLIWYKKRFFEGALIKLVEEGNTLAILFTNKTQNRDLGYAEKIDVRHSGTVNHNLKVEVRYSIDRLNLPLETRKQILLAIREMKKAHPVEPPQTVTNLTNVPQLKPGRAKLAAIIDEE